MESTPQSFHPDLTTAALTGPQVCPWDSGPDVIELQELLCAHGFGLKIDGDFGNATEAAVKACQRQHNLKIDGIAGPQTWAALKATVKAGTRTLCQGATGIDVFELQGLLQVNGYPVCRDGIFEAQTREAVVNLQKRHQLKADGRVGPITWTVLRGNPPLPQPPKRTHWFFDGRRWW